MKRTVLCLLTLVLVFTATASFASAQVAPTFKLGFKALADRIPTVVGQPLENEHWAANGNSQQQTSKGLMAWREADNWTAFTNGARTWINGPYGVQSRLNTVRFPWEKDPPVVTSTAPTQAPPPTPAPQQQALVDGAFVKGSGPQVFKIEGGKKRGFLDWNAFLNAGGKADLSNVQLLTDDRLASIPSGSDIGAPIPTAAPVRQNATEDAVISVVKQVPGPKDCGLPTPDARVTIASSSVAISMVVPESRDFNWTGKISDAEKERYVASLLGAVASAFSNATTVEVVIYQSLYTNSYPRSVPSKYVSVTSSYLLLDKGIFHAFWPDIRGRWVEGRTEYQNEWSDRWSEHY